MKHHLYQWTESQWLQRDENGSTLAIVNMPDGSVRYRLWSRARRKVDSGFQLFPDSHHHSMRHMLPLPGMPYPPNELCPHAWQLGNHATYMMLLEG